MLSLFLSFIVSASAGQPIVVNPIAREVSVQVLAHQIQCRPGPFGLSSLMIPFSQPVGEILRGGVLQTSLMGDGSAGVDECQAALQELTARAGGDGLISLKLDVQTRTVLRFRTQDTCEIARDEVASFRLGYLRPVEAELISLVAADCPPSYAGFNGTGKVNNVIYVLHEDGVPRSPAL